MALVGLDKDRIHLMAVGSRSQHRNHILDVAPSLAAGLLA
jgi:hypothetical protein